MTLPVAQKIHPAGNWPKLTTGRVILGYDERFLRRKRLVMASGEGFLVDLAETTNCGGRCVRLWTVAGRNRRQRKKRCW